VDDAGHTEIFRGFHNFCLWRRSEVLFTDRSDRSPEGFLDIYEWVETVRSLSADGVTVTVEVTGSLTDTAEPVRLSGTLSQTNPGRSPVDPDGAVPSDGVGPLGVVVETEDGTTCSVGGRGAVGEDVEATRITVTDVSDS